MNGATEDAGPSRKDWAIAYASQARSDWELYETLQERGEPRCHQLHYLQMASEKIAKAYRFRDTSTSEDSLLTQHVGFIKFLNAFLKSDRVKQMYKETRQLREVSKRCRQLASEIEKLAPAVDAGKRPANPEYPWQQGGEVITPRDHEFPNLALLDAPAGRTFLKLLKIGIFEFESIAVG